ncbi:MAG TPA: glycosyltransferase family 2 protein [Deltaproteobacteria bacterium]|nr:glycosyltransferase family 2 protein [Deltaproteobacteria bacterium]HIJ39825.1 glycosyltransferase family 2 protein [Deltaproteobacteria bacterium]
MAKISVIIPTFNRALKVARAVASVLYQRYTDYEIVVVDDGSDDDTRTFLKQFGKQIRRIDHAKNRGVSAARNTGIQNTDSPFIAFLDSDDYWLPGKLERQMNFFSTEPAAVICQTEEIWIRNGHFANPAKKHRKPTGDLFIPSLKLCLISPSAVMVKRSLLEEVGRFDESLPACEDYDLWLRIACRYPVPLIKEWHVVKEGGHPDQLSSRYRGMDRFRIEAIVKLLKSGVLDLEQTEEAMAELSRKCVIYGKGCLKRKKLKEGNHYLALPKQLEGEIRKPSGGQVQC